MRGLVRGGDAGEGGGQEAVPGHDHEDPDLAVEGDEQGRDHPDDGARGHQGAPPADADPGEGCGEGVADVDLLIRNHTGQDKGYGEIEDDDDPQADHEAQGDCALGIAGFLGGRGDRVEPDVGEENEGGSGHDPLPAERSERVEVGEIDMGNAQKDKQQDHGDLDSDDDVVELAAFPDPDVEDPADAHGDEDRGQVDHAAGKNNFARRGRRQGRQDQGLGQFQSHLLEQREERGRPSGGDGAGRDQVLEHQVPADDPGDDLAEGHIGVGVSAPGDWEHAGQLGVGEGAKGAGDGGDDEGHQDAGPGQLGSLARGYKDPGADDRPDP